MDEIYIVEDDENIRELVAYALKSNGFEAQGFETGADFFRALDTGGTPNLVLLDIMLPEEDGLSILSRIREKSDNLSLPVIMMTAKGSEFDKVKGLDMGADDYVTKPFGVTELISRIKAVLRRTKADEDKSQILIVGDIHMDSSRRSVLAGDREANLTYKEYELLHYLMLNAGMALSREQLLDRVWGYDFGGETRTVDMHIKSIRRKLGSAGDCIKTVRNIGYKIGD